MLGMWTGAWLGSEASPQGKLRGLVVWGVVLTLAGLALDGLHVCPVVKRIWTPAYTLSSGGLVLLMLAAFNAVIDVKGWKAWSFPLLVIGANSITAYVMSWTIKRFVAEALVRHLGRNPFLILGPPFEPVLSGAAVLAVFWAILYWMYKRGIFIKI